MEYLLGLYEKAMPNTLTWEEKLQHAKKAGFDFIEISIDETKEKLARLDSTKAEREDLVYLMKEIGLPIRSMCLSGHRKYPLGSMNSEVRDYSLEIMEKAIELADDLGIRIIQIAGYDVFYEKSTDQTVSNFRENLQKCVEMAAKKGVILGFETMETAFMNTVAKSMYYVNAVQSPYLQVYPDVGNLINAAVTYESDVWQDMRLGAGHYVASHLKETLPGIFREVPFGTGHTDFINSIATMWQCGVRRFVGEFWYTGKEDWVNDLAFANTFLRDKFANAEKILAKC